MSNKHPTSKIAQAIYTINRHAKTAPEPQHLYYLKNESIKQLLKEKRAKKLGLHFSNRPKMSHQHSICLVKVDQYYFHILPTKKDMKVLKHLGPLDGTNRNPQTNMSLSASKRIIYEYINYKPKEKNKKKTPFERSQRHSPYYTPSSLGQMQWPPTNKR